MDIKNSTIISKLIEAKPDSLILTGHPFVDSESSPYRIRVYPSLNLSRYFEIDESDVQEIVEDSACNQPTSFLIRKDADIRLVSKHPASDVAGSINDQIFTPMNKKVPPYRDRLWDLLGLASAAFLEAYVGTESIPGPGQTGHPLHDLQKYRDWALSGRWWWD